MNHEKMDTLRSGRRDGEPDFGGMRTQARGRRSGRWRRNGRQDSGWRRCEEQYGHPDPWDRNKYDRQVNLAPLDASLRSF